MSQPPSNQIFSNLSIPPINNNNNTTRMDANIPIQYNNNNSNNNNNKNNKNNGKDNTKKVDIYIICNRSDPRQQITFRKKEEVEEHLRNHPYHLTPAHFLFGFHKKRKEKEYYISKLFESFLRGTKTFGSLHHFNQILTMTSDEFNLLVHGNSSKHKDSQTRKITESLSEVSPDFVFRKLYPNSSSYVIEFLNFHNNINNNNNNNNNAYNNNNDNNNNNNNNDNNNYLHVEQYNNDNNENLFDDYDHQNNNNDDPMLIDNDSIMEHFPPQFQPDLNLPYDPFDRPSIGRDGEGFDGEKLRYICSMEQVDSEFFYSYISSSNLIDN